MSEIMTFPETVEEYMEQYKVVDTEKVYTSGTELVPIFRMIQWFEHLPAADLKPIVRCKDCKHFSEAACKGIGWCKRVRDTRNSEWYCADGDGRG